MELADQCQSHFCGPSTFGRLFQDATFWTTLERTGIWTVGTVLVEYIVGFPLALALNHRTRLTGLATGLMLLPWVTPTVVCAYAWVWVLNSQYGYVYAVLHALHILAPRHPWPPITVLCRWLLWSAGGKECHSWPWPCWRR